MKMFLSLNNKTKEAMLEYLSSTEGYKRNAGDFLDSLREAKIETKDLSV